MPREDILRPSRRRRRRRSILKLSLFLLGIFVLAGGVISFFYVPKFRITEIAIEGTNSLDKEELRAEIANFLKGKFFKILPYDNIFILPKTKITASLLQEFPSLKEISIKRDFSRKLSVLVGERKAEALWCVNSVATSTDSSGPASTSASLGGASCAFIDENGFIFQPAPFFSGKIFPVFYDKRQEPADIGKEIMVEAEFKKLSSFEELLDNNGIYVSEVFLKDEGIYEVYLKEGWHILLNSKNEPNLSFNNLKLILDSNVKEKRPKLEYIDLRFGNKVFFKFK